MVEKENVKSKNIAVLISGGGTNLQAIIDAEKLGQLNGKIKLVISSKDAVYGLKRAQMAEIDTLVVNRKAFTHIDEFNNAILTTLKRYNIDLVVLAGYLSIVGENIIKEFRNKIINIHPSLIPSFCGMGYYGLKVHQAVLDYGVKVTGATVHFVDEEADTGSIILQEVVAVEGSETAEELQQKVLKIEHKLLPRAVQLFCLDRIKVEGRKVIISKEN